jgi:hypothetical protein
MIHINRFIDRIRSTEARQARDVIMSLNEARDLHADITRLLLALEQQRLASQASPTPETVTVEIQGGSF